MLALDPEGAAHMGVRRFQSSQDGESENPRLNWVEDLVLSGELLSFVTRAKRESV